MGKYVTIYQPNALGEIEKIETVDGVVVEEQADAQEQADAGNVFNTVWNFFNFRKGEDAPPKRKPFNDNGREYNESSGNWEYTSDRNGNGNPFEVNYEAPQDYQGSVPVNDL